VNDPRGEGIEEERSIEEECNIEEERNIEHPTSNIEC